MKKHNFMAVAALLLICAAFFAACPSDGSKKIKPEEEQPKVLGIAILDSNGNPYGSGQIDGFIGGSIQFEVEVQAENNASLQVKWEIEGGNGKSFIENDKLTIAEDEEPGTVLTIKASSVEDPSQSVSIKVKLRSSGAVLYDILVGGPFEGGSVSIEGGIEKAEEGETVNFTVTTDTGYSLNDFSVAGSDGNPVQTSGSDGAYAFVMPAANVTITAVFDQLPPPKYAIAVSVTGNGSIEIGDEIEEAEEGRLITLNVNADSGHFLDILNVTDQDENFVEISIEDETFTFIMPAANVTVTAVFNEISKYSITLSPVTGGKIIVEGGIALSEAGKTITLKVIANSGFVLDTVSVIRQGGSPVAVSGSDETYTFIMPAAYVSVSAVFTEIKYNINISPATNGNISVSSGLTQSTAGKLITLNVISNSGYVLDTINVTPQGGSPLQVSGSGGTYTFTMPLADVTVAAVFKEAPKYSITLSPAVNGSLSVSGGLTQSEAGKLITLNVSANSGYIFDSVTVTPQGGSPLQVNGSGGTYTFTMPSANVTAAAVFKAIPKYSITVSPATGGSVSVTGGITQAEAGQTISLNVNADSGYVFNAIFVLINGIGVTLNDLGGGAYSFTMPEDDVTVMVSFKAIPKYNISISPATGGSVSVSGGLTQAEAGQSITLNVTINSGYVFDGINVTSAGNPVQLSGSGTTYTFTMPAGNVTVAAAFNTIPEYSITLSPVTGGSVSVTGGLTQSKADQLITLNVSTNGGYNFDGITVTPQGGSPLQVNGSGGTYTFTMPAANVTVTAVFSLQSATKYTITVSSASNGSVSIAGGITQSEADKTITMNVSANSGYVLNTITVTPQGGSPLPVNGLGDGVYTFTMPAANVTVAAVFNAIPKYTITVNTVTGGSVSVSGGLTQEEAGKTVTLTVSTNSGYTFSSLSVTSGGNPVTLNGSGPTYTFTMPAGNVTVTPVFNAIPKYNITVNSVIGGSVSVSGGLTQAEAGQTVTLNVSTNSGYTFSSINVTYGGNTVPVSGSGTTYTFTMPAANVTIAGVFNAIPKYNITVNSVTGGSVSVAGGLTQSEAGQTITLNVSANSGYTFGSITVTPQGGSPLQVNGSGGTYTFTMPAANVTVAAVFNAVPKYNITVSPATGGSVSVSGGLTQAEAGQTVTLNVSANSGYAFSSIFAHNNGNGVTVNNMGGGVYTFTMPSGDVTVIASFTQITYAITTTGISNGTVSADYTQAAAGTTVTLTVKPNTNYLYVSDSLKVNNGAVTLTSISSDAQGNIRFTFTMPAQAAAVTCSFVYSTEDPYFTNEFNTGPCSFFDKFDGTSLNLSKWGYQNGNGSEYGNANWGNNERQSYRTENVTVANGILTITAKYTSTQVNGKNYTSGKIVTANSKGLSSLGEPSGGTGVKFGQTYGRFEAKMRMNAGKGAWPAFWMLSVTEPYGGWPRSGEIDIMEMVGYKKNNSSSTLHMKPNWGTWESQYAGSTHTFQNSKTFEDWHVYGVLWTPTEITFLLDGLKARTLARTWWNSQWYTANGFPSSTNNYPPFNQNFFFIINLALDSGQFDSNNGIDNNQTGLNYTLEVDWIRAYTTANDPWPAPSNYPSGLWTNHGN